MPSVSLRACQALKAGFKMHILFVPFELAISGKCFITKGTNIFSFFHVVVILNSYITNIR